eukprot:scaffold10022_cov156-Skeletonema_marinoi.AAC.13
MTESRWLSLFCCYFKAHTSREASVLAFSAEVDSLFMVIKVETTQEITFTQCRVGHSYREHDQNDRRHWQDASITNASDPGVNCPLSSSKESCKSSTPYNTEDGHSQQ